MNQNQYGFFHPIVKRFLTETGLYSAWKEYLKSRLISKSVAMQVKYVGIDAVFASSAFTSFLKRHGKIPEILDGQYNISTFFRAYLVAAHFEDIMKRKIRIKDPSYYKYLHLSNELIIKLETMTGNKLDWKDLRNKVSMLSMLA